MNDQTSQGQQGQGISGGQQQQQEGFADIDRQRTDPGRSGDGM
jgi:hypothetical protein